MNTDQINRWLSLVANLGVIVGIFFLVFEIRQSNRIALATNEIAIRDSYGSVNELLSSNSEISGILAKARDPDSTFTGTEREMAESFVARMFNIWIATERAYDQGMASRALLEIALDDLRWHYESFPGFRDFIRGNVSIYSANNDTEVYRAASALVEDRQDN